MCKWFIENKYEVWKSFKKKTTFHRSVFASLKFEFIYLFISNIVECV